MLPGAAAKSLVEVWLEVNDRGTSTYGPVGISFIRGWVNNGRGGGSGGDDGCWEITAGILGSSRLTSIFSSSCTSSPLSKDLGSSSDETSSPSSSDGIACWNDFGRGGGGGGGMSKDSSEREQAKNGASDGSVSSDVSSSPSSSSPSASSSPSLSLPSSALPWPPSSSKASSLA